MELLEIFVTILRWVAMLTMFGAMIYAVRKKGGIILEFVPVFLCASIAVVVFLCGLMGFLLQGVYAICAVGLACVLYLVRDIVRAGKGAHKGYWKCISIPQVVFCLGALLFLMQLLQTNLVHYDNYSHWAVVVKEMLITKAVPTADSVMIEFKNYPLGMTSFIYFVCELVGHGQSTMLFAQGLVVFSCFYALFGIITEKKRTLLYVFLGAGCSILSIFNLTIRINNLLVDFILPVLTLAILAVMYRYRLEIHKMYLLICPMIGLLVVVKSTGIVYATFTILYLCYLLLRFKRAHTQEKLMQIETVSIYKREMGLLLFLKTCGVIAASMVTTIAWSVHMKVAFAGVENKFEVDASKLQGVYAGKTQEDVANIIRLFVNTILDVTTQPTIGIILFELLALAGCVVGVGVLKKKWMLPKALVALNGMLVLYYAGILGMYIFSMPLEEAVYLAGFERYACSIVILFGGALTMCATIDIEQSFHYQIGMQTDYRAFKTIEHKKVYNGGVIVCIALALLILSSEFNGLWYQMRAYQHSLPAKVRAIVGDCWADDVDDARYLVYASDMDGQVTSCYLQYVTKYYLRANQVDGLCYFYEDNMLNLLSQYDKLIIIEPDQEQKALMEKYLHVSGEVGVYDLHSINTLENET